MGLFILGVRTLAKNGLDIGTLEGWLWEAACKIRGEVDAPKYKEYILPLIFIKRLSDVFEDELAELGKEYGSLEVAEGIVQEDHSVIRFYIPTEGRWGNLSKKTTNIGEYLTTAVRHIVRENPKLQGVIDIVDFNATAAGQRIISDDSLKALVSVLNKHRLGLKDVEPDILGRAYEYLLRKFAEGSGQSAGEFYTPGEVAVLMSFILDPEPGDTIYDPTCGSGGLLIKSYLRFKDKYKEKPTTAPLKFHGQEINHTTFAMAKMNAFIHEMDTDVAIGDTMNRPAFLNADGSLRQFDKVTANPMWNQDFPQSTYENDAYGRFGYGFPPSSTADWGWIQHMYSSLTAKGKLAVVIDTGAVSRGSGTQGANRERDIRKALVDIDMVECVILMPENLFYNTSASGIILVLNKSNKRKGEIILINASKLFAKGRPKNYLTDENISQVFEAYSKWQEVEGISKVIKKEEAIKNDYNLSPSRYIAINGGEEVMPLEEAVVLLKEAEEERAEADKRLKKIMGEMGFAL